MVEFDLEQEVELSNNRFNISSKSMSATKEYLISKAIDSVIEYLYDELDFDADGFSDEEILRYCRLDFNPEPTIDHNAYGGLVVATFYMRCYFDDDNFLEKHVDYL